MDFYKLIQSLDDLLYELLSWVLFYPTALWRVTVRPVATMLAAEEELRQAKPRQFDDMLGPPLFLFVTLLLIHFLELGIVGEVSIVHSNRGLARLITDDTNLVIFRVLTFGVLPLAAARRLIGAQGVKVDKFVLRPPFYAQCYAAAMFAVILGAANLVHASKVAGGDVAAYLLYALAAVWLLSVETVWFARKLKQGAVRAFGNSLLMLLQWLLLLIPIAWLLSAGQP